MSLQVLTGGEVAKLLRVSRDTVYRLAASGALPGRKIGRIWRFSRDAIEQYLQDRPAGISSGSGCSASAPAGGLEPGPGRRERAVTRLEEENASGRRQGSACGQYGDAR